MKIFLIVVAIIIAIVLIGPAFIDEDIKITRTIEIEKPVETVYSVVKDFNYYQQWNAWSQMDKNAKSVISGPTGEVGAKYSWEGDTVGIGSLTLEELNENKSIQSRLEFVEPMAMVTQDLWNFKSVDSTTTRVEWSFNSTATSYMMRWANVMLDSQLGPDLETGLSNLKELIENLPQEEPQEMMEMETEEEVI